MMGKKMDRSFSARKVIFLSIVFYQVLWIAELSSKAMALIGDLAGGRVTSSVAAKVSEGARLLVTSIIGYAATLVIVYAGFALLNAMYALWAARWLVERRGRLAAHPLQAAFLFVNGAFLVGTYGLNAALYPASNLAMARRLASPMALTVISAVVLGLYVLGLIILTAKQARLPVKVLVYLLIGGLSLMPLDPAYHIRKLFSSRAPAGNAGPNIIIIGLDSLNPLHTGYAGYPLETTPHLDAFLRENVVFDNCYTSIARTFPSWYSILTGQYPKTSGARLNLMNRKYLKSTALCLGNILQKEGYWTAHFTDEVRFSNILPKDGFIKMRHPPMGVRDFLLGSVHDFSLINVYLNNRLGYGIFPFSDINRAIAPIYRGRYFTNDIISALPSLRQHGRFFLAVHLCTAHWPYVYASPHIFDPAPGVDPIMLPYDSSLRAVDDQLGRILAALKAEGLYDNSIIVVLSDHGEAEGGHGNDLGDSEQNRVLLAWKPIGPASHLEFPDLVRTIDVAPTILDLLGRDPASLPYDGKTLKPLILREAAGRPLDDQSVIMETEFSLDALTGLTVQSLIEQGVEFYEIGPKGLLTVRENFYDLLLDRRSRAIMTPRWKLVLNLSVRSGRQSVQRALYDLQVDPECRTDVSPGQPGIVAELMGRLRAYYGAELARYRP